MPHRQLISAMSFFLCTMSILEGVVTVSDAEGLNRAIINANAGKDTHILFVSNIEYAQSVQPFNADNVLNPVNQTITVDGGPLGFSLKATKPARAFFARTNNNGSVTIRNLTIRDAVALGGSSLFDGFAGGGGGGGLGAGGALFLNSGSTVILDDVSFVKNRAIGGDSNTGSNGGGGGLGGNGGSASAVGASGGGGFNGNGGAANGIGASGGGGFNGFGFNGKGGSSPALNGGSGAGGGGGGYSGGDANQDTPGGGAGDGGDGQSTGTGGIGSPGETGSPGGVGGALAFNNAGSGAVAAASGHNGTAEAGGSLPGGGGGSGYTENGNTGDGGDGGFGFGGGGSGSNVTGTTGTGGKGGFGGGGGGSGSTGSGTAGTGGAGGFGGGGGAGGPANQLGSTDTTNGTGGAGGFGGGGGSAGGVGGIFNGKSGAGGDGGFGGGGGGSPGGQAGMGGFGGGNGFSNQGGGGGAMGADIFIENGASLTIQKGISFSGSTLRAGSGANNGQELGTNIFMMSGGDITVENLTKLSVVPNPIESDLGAGGGGINSGGLTLGDKNSATFVLVGANTYTGRTAINTGTLNLKGSVITPVILNGGTFSGNASLLLNTGILGTGDLTVSNGTVRPGDIVFGQIQVGNNLLFEGGKFLTEVDSVNNARRIDVTKTATLAGSITVDRAIGNFLGGQIIPLINANGGVFRKFETENIVMGADGLPLFSVQYTGNQVQLLTIRDHVFIHPMIDPGNPRHVAKYILDQLPIDPNSDFGLVVRSLGVLTDKELNKVLNMMHQGVFGTLEFMNMTTNIQLMQMFNQPRFRLFTPFGSGDLATSALEPGLTASAKETIRQPSKSEEPFYPSTPLQRGCERDYCKHHSVYFQPFGTWNTQSPKGELRGFNYENAGFLTGYDYFFHNFYVGAGAGYAYTNYRWDQDTGKGHIHQVYGGVHGSYFNRYFSMILASMVGGNFYEMHRNIISSAPNHPAADLDRTAHSNNSGLQWTNRLELVGDFSPFSFPLQLFANVTHFYLHNGSFSETGANSINLRVNTKVSNALRSELGVSSSYTFKVSAGCWTPYIRMSWVNKTLLSSSTYRGGFRGQVGTFSASATSKGTNQWAPGAGVEFANTHGFSLLLNSRAEINGKVKNYSADMRMEFAF